MQNEVIAITDELVAAVAPPVRGARLEHRSVMVKRVAIAFLLGPSVAFAQSAPGTTTPTVVESASPDTATVLPSLFEQGNLRISLRCAESWLSPAGGLAVTVDGTPRSAQTVNGQWSTSTDDDGNDSTTWNATDVGYLVAPGHHHVQIDAPHCAPAAFDMDAYADHAQRAVGRLAASDWSLEGTAGAPNGVGVTLGMMRSPASHGAQVGYGQTNSYAPGLTSTGGFLSVSYEGRHSAVAFDQAVSKGPMNGVASGPTAGSAAVGPVPFTGNAIDWRTQLRIGLRWSIHDVALMTGSGAGFDMWFPSTQFAYSSADTALTAPDGADGSFYFPMWVGATIKPACDWGFQVIGQYDVHPFSMDTNGVSIAGGLMFQPSASCSEPAGVHVSPG